MSQIQEARLPELLKFNPKIWWDPVPWWFVDRLDRDALGRVAAIQLEAQRDMLRVQMEAIEKSIAVIKRTK